MKLGSPKAKLAAYVAVVAVVSAMSLAVIFHFERNSVAFTGIARAVATRAVYGRLPLSFQENMGQTDSHVRFVSRGSGYELFLTPEEAVLALRHSSAATSPRDRVRAMRRNPTDRHPDTASLLSVRFAGANPSAQIVGAEKLPGRVDYFIGNDPKNWRTNIPSYSRVQYKSIYPGVDLVFYGNQRQLEYDFVVSPGADAKSITLEVTGASRLRVDGQGNLVVAMQDGEVEFHRPVVYQRTRDGLREVAGSYALADSNRVTFSVSGYDRSLPLVVDPVLNYSTYLGGSADDSGNAIAIDSSGDAYVAGQTFSTDFPTVAANAVNAGPITTSQAANGTVFVTELNPAGTAELYSTYLTGSGSGIGGNQDGAFGIAVDGSGKIYVTGSTFSTDFPTTSNAFNPGPEPSSVNSVGTAFLTKIDPSQSTGAKALVYSTFLGGTGGDAAAAVAADANGNAYVAGITLSTDFTPVNGIPSPPNAAGLPNALGSAFVARIDTTKSGPTSLVYMTLLGGNGANSGGNATFSGEGFAEFALGIDVDTSNNAYVTGITTSTGSTFPTTTGALQTSADPDNTAAGAFFSKINTAASGLPSLVYSTYLEGNVLDEGNAIAIGPGGVAYITGDTQSTNFNLTNPAVVLRAHPHGVAPAPIFANGGTFPSAPSSAGVAFLTLIDPTKTNVTSPKYGVLIGGTNNSDIGHGVRADAAGNAYLTGGASSSNFPTTFGALQTTRLSGLGDGFVAKINPAGNGASDLVYSTYFGGKDESNALPDVAFGIAIDSAPSPGPNAYITGQTLSLSTAQTGGAFPVTTGAFSIALNGNSDAFVAKITLEPTVSVSPTALNFGTVSVGTTSAPETVTVTNNTAVTVTFAGTPFTFTGTNPGDFAVAPTPTFNGVNACGLSVAAGASCVENVTFTPAAGPAPLPGAESATLDINDSDSSSPQTVALTGNGTTAPPDFTVTAPATFMVQQGMSGSFTVTVTPENGFDQTVALTCSGLPMFTTCTPTPTSVMLTDGRTAQTSSVMIATNQPTSTTALPPRTNVPTIPLFGATVALALCAMATFTSARARRYRLPLAFGMLSLLFVFAGCGGGGKPKNPNMTPIGTTTITITGTAGNLMHAAQVSLMVTAP